MKTRIILNIMVLLSTLTCWAARSDEAEQPFWTLNSEGGITWVNDGRSHTDHIEMAGRQIAVVLHYGINATGRYL